MHFHEKTRFNFFAKVKIKSKFVDGGVFGGVGSHARRKK
jgi:hypothetical protein